MTLPAWWQIAAPHEDIRQGKLNEAIFAADLGDVLDKKAPLEYQDPSVFFQKTYMTHGLENLLNNVIGRLNGEMGDPVIQLQTPFGGGKTHALLTLYHYILHPTAANLDQAFPKTRNAKVAVFVGTQADVIAGKTPWGEIAEQLGQYEVVKEHDKQRIAPGKKRLRQILEASGPTLIMIDELLEYIVKANRAEHIENVTRGQTLAFLQELTEVVTSSPNCCLVITLPASVLERYDEQAEAALQQLQKITGRVEAVYAPVEGIEVFEVIRKRLFEDIGEERARQEVAQHYFAYYQTLSTDVPSEVKEIEYRDRMERAYPFHPELIEVLYERWGSFPTFQRTRGVLRLLAEVVADLYERKVLSPLIQSSLINLDNQVIRREFIKHIGNDFDSVISSDIAGRNAKAPKVDKEMGSEYAKYNIAQGIATAVFLYSFSAGTSQSTTLPRIRIATLREGIPTTIVGDAISKLEGVLWFFHSENRQYAFTKQITLNRVIVEKQEQVDTKLANALKGFVEEVAGSYLSVILWPETPSDIADNKNLKLVIISPSISYGSDKAEELAKDLLEQGGSGFRIYKNTLFILVTDRDQRTALEKSLRLFLALTDIKKDKSTLDKLSADSQKELNSRFKDVEKEIPFKVINAYRRLAMQSDKGLVWQDLGLPTLGVDRSLSERVFVHLKDQERIFDRISSKNLLNHTFAQDEKTKDFRDIYDIILKTPGLSVPESESALLNSIGDGVKSGEIGLTQGSEVFFLQQVVPNADCTVLRAEYAKELKAQQDEELRRRNELKEEDRIATKPNLDDVIIGLERTACYGSCPVYKLTILGTGDVTYEGKMFVKTIGTRTAKVNQDVIKQLISEFEKVGFLSLNDSYEEHTVTDNPTVVMSVKTSDKSKVVHHYRGDSSAPSELTSLEDKIDELVNSYQWTKEEKDEIIKKITVQVIVPWDTLSALIRGVIGPLQDKGQVSDISVGLEATSEDGFDRRTLESKVKETLQQIHAKIEQWTEERG